jgi:hypothetical protein
MDFRDETVEALAGRVRAKDVSARELTQAALDRIEALNPKVNAFVAVDADLALADAARIDEQTAAGEDPGPLAGIPIGVKDLEDAAGFVTTQGSLLRKDDAPAGADSALVSRLRSAGCVVLGRRTRPSSVRRARRRTGCSASPATRGTSSAPAADRRAGRPRRSRRGWCRWRRAPTAAGRSASPRRCAGSPA